MTKMELRFFLSDAEFQGKNYSQNFLGVNQF
jgi:hypothetical protein